MTNKKNWCGECNGKGWIPDARGGASERAVSGPIRVHPTVAHGWRPTTPIAITGRRAKSIQPAPPWRRPRPTW